MGSQQFDLRRANISSDLGNSKCHRGTSQQWIVERKPCRSLWRQTFNREHHVGRRCTVRHYLGNSQHSGCALVSTGTLNATRSGSHTCTLLTTGNVLIVGGIASPGTYEIRTSAGALVSSGSLWASRASHSTTLLTSGNVLIVGGSASGGTWEIRNSTGGLVSTGSLWALRNGHCDVLLPNGNVFLGGGTNAIRPGRSETGAVHW